MIDFNIDVETQKKLHLKLFIILLFVLGNAFVWSSLPAFGGKYLTVVFFDVGQGDAIFIEGPNGNQVLIDTGPSTNILQRLGEVMNFNDRSIDIVILTHPDKDHIGGAPAVLNNYEVSFVLDPGVASDTEIFGKYQEALEDENADYKIAYRGMQIDLGRGVFIDILSPSENVDYKDANDASVVVRLVYGETSVVLTGDASKNIERNIETAFSEIKSDILKAGHHGSKTSSLSSFVEKVSPAFAIISASANNSYGHPAGEVLATLSAVGAIILETSKEGNIVFVSDGREFVRK